MENRDEGAPRLGLVLDCKDPEVMTAFYTVALGYVCLGTQGTYTKLVPEGRPGPQFLLQRVDEPKTAKNRMHLDIHPADVEATVARLEGLGARRLEPGPVQEFGEYWFVMADPEGNEFCICSPEC